MAEREQSGLMGASVGTDSELSRDYHCAVQEHYWNIFAELASKSQRPRVRLYFGISGLQDEGRNLRQQE